MRKREETSESQVFRRGNDGTAYWIDQEGPGPYDNMEQRGNAERCLLGFSGAVPTYPSLYNNFKRIVQTEDHVMILIEMVHDARIIRLNSDHPPASEKKWLGDSIGWWEGDTLVIDTTNFHPQTGRRGSSENNHVVERFTRLEDGNLLYRFTVEDDAVWTAPWTGEYVWRASDQKVYEYACHEGNYALGNIMRGARILEKDALGSEAEECKPLTGKTPNAGRVRADRIDSLRVSHLVEVAVHNFSETFHCPGKARHR